jgi:hypothetical protein
MSHVDDVDDHAETESEAEIETKTEIKPAEAAYLPRGGMPKKRKKEKTDTRQVQRTRTNRTSSSNNFRALRDYSWVIQSDVCCQRGGATPMKH